MLPVVTPAEMRAVDAEATEPVDVLIERAGRAVARSALELLGGAYGRRVVVVAGPGSNGADGRVAARRLARAGVRVAVLDAAASGGTDVSGCDLVVDAAYGTGFRGTWEPPAVGSAPVLAVDLPSGVDGLSGEATGPVLAAVRTVTFAALKPGLLLGVGRASAGAVEVVDIGLDVSRARVHLVTDDDVGRWLPRRGLEAHKWQAAVWLVAGSPGMTGAASLAARGAQRAGAGYVRLSTPGAGAGDGTPIEAVGTPLPVSGWGAAVCDGAARFGALALGPGLGRADGTAAEVRAVVDGRGDVPLVVDGDGLHALGEAPTVGPGVVLTPHDGEYGRLAGRAPGPDRVEAARRLATAGTGDVLTGIVAALLAGGLDPLRAAAAGAHVHGLAGNLGWRRGLVAGDLPDHVPAVLDRLAGT